jgi:ribosomal protein S16
VNGTTHLEDDTARRQLTDEAQDVLRLPREAIEEWYHEGVVFADRGQRLVKPASIEVLAAVACRRV